MYSENLDLLGNFLNRTSQALDLFHVMICQAIRVAAMFFYISRIWRLGDQPMIPGRAACGLFRSPVAGALCMVWFLSDGQTVEGLGNKSAVNAEKRNRKDRHLGIWKVMQGIPNQKPFHLDCSCGHYWQALSHGFDF